MGLVVLAEPIIAVIYEHGKFTAASTVEAASALQFYTVGLLAYCGIKILAPAFYAMDRRRTPMLVSFGAIGVNLLLNWLFAFRLGLGHRGLALSTGCVAVLNCGVLYLLMRRHAGSLQGGLLAGTVWRVLAACVPMAGVCFVARTLFFRDLHGLSFWFRAGALGVTITASALVFFGCVLLLRVGEMEVVSEMLKRRWARWTGR